MIERLTIRNFKRFEQVEVELGQRVVFVGPNDSGKTTALQALALWELGVRRWIEKRGSKPVPSKRSGVTINRRELVSLPVPDAKQLWRDLHVRNVERVDGKPRTQNILIDLEVQGVSKGERWTCGLEFDFANPESVYCRPMPSGEREAGRAAGRMPVPDIAGTIRVAFLPPMSGLKPNEARLDPGAVQVRLGEGRTAEVLRNLCWQVLERDPDGPQLWGELTDRIRRLFDAELLPPDYVPERGELTISYRTAGGTLLDISAAGRGMLQTLLLTAYLMANPDTVLLLDEPDAHLEFLRQRQVYDLLTEVAAHSGCQLIMATHSEVLLAEAAGRDLVVAFIGEPHRIDDRGSQAAKALREIGFDHFLQAEQTGWVLYVEGSTDLAILRSFARTLDHPALVHLERPFVHYVGNQPSKAQGHFFGLKEACSGLVAIGIFDSDAPDRESAGGIRFEKWQRREIENYLCFPEVLEAYASSLAEDRAAGPLFLPAQKSEYLEAMQEAVRDRVPPLALRDRDDPWWRNTRASEEFLGPVFEAFFRKIGLPNRMQKTNYHELARLVPAQDISEEIVRTLDRIGEVADGASGRS